MAEFRMENSFGELLGPDGEDIEFEWKKVYLIAESPQIPE